MDAGALQRAFEEKHGVRTDLAVEAHEVVVEQQGPPELPGVKVDTQRTEHALVSRVSIESDVGSQLMGKVKGKYSTIEAPSLKERNQEAQQEVGDLLAREIRRFMDQMGIPEGGGALVVGLGNWNATPDALGPKAVGEVMVTRHLHARVPPEVRGGLRPISAISPGVLGLTGIETGEIVKGIVDKIGPDMVICLDALSARSTQRVCSTIQLSDTGISPGSGVGNRREGITQESLGVPVLALGVPTVVYAATIVSDGMEIMSRQGAPNGQGEPGTGASPGADGNGAPASNGRQFTGEEIPKPTRLAPDPRNIRTPQAGNTGAPGVAPAQSAPAGRGAPNAQSGPAGAPSSVGGSGASGVGGAPGGAPPPANEARKQAMMQQLLAPFMGNMVVTPKAIDLLIEDIAETVAIGINTVMHENVDMNNVLSYIQ